jgi:hypothetical protein
MDTPDRDSLIDLATWISEQPVLDVATPDEAVDLYLEQRELPPRPPIKEQVRTDAGWHGRIRGANGEPVWTTEVLEDQRAVREAYALLARSVYSGVRAVDERELDRG